MNLAMWQEQTDAILLLAPSSPLNLTHTPQEFLLEHSFYSRIMASASVDVKELPASYVFVADVPGLTNTDIKVQIENDSILKISGERKREDNPSFDVKYVRVERAVGKFMRKFNLPANANLEQVSASCQDGILTVTVPKIAPPEPHKPKTFDIQVANTTVAEKK